MNYSMGAPEPTVGETIWMTCPYRAELCGAEATMTVESITPDEVAGVVVCSNGHRWRIAKLSEGLQ